MIGKILLETARGEVKERVLTREETAAVIAELERAADRAKHRVAHYYRLPLRFVEPASDSDHNGPHIVAADGSIVAKLFWPCHPANETEAAEQATYALGRAMAGATDPTDANRG